MATASQVNKGGIGPAVPYRRLDRLAHRNCRRELHHHRHRHHPVVTEEYVAEVFVPHNCQSTGISVLNGSAVAGNMQCALYDSNGNLMATTASTAASGTAAFQQVPMVGRPEPQGARPSTSSACRTTTPPTASAPTFGRQLRRQQEDRPDLRHLHRPDRPDHVHDGRRAGGRPVLIPINKSVDNG
jgi:hypothetical protein